MADQKISQLPAVSSINLTDLSPLVQNGQTVEAPFSVLLSFVAANLTVGAKFTFPTALPQNTIGSDGDVAIITTAGQIAQKVSGTWVVKYTFPTGSTGNTVYYGTTAPVNTDGVNGDSYINTVTAVFYKKASGIWNQVFSFTPGAAGADGKTILNGTVDPVNTQGNNGDFYLNTASLVLFGPKASGLWPTGVSLRGNQLLNGTTAPGNTTTGNNGDFYINTNTMTIYGPKANGAWPAGISLLSASKIKIGLGNAGVTYDSTSQKLTYTYQSGDTLALGDDEPVAELWINGQKSNIVPLCTYTNNDVTQPVTGVSFDSPFDNTTYSAGKWKIILRS